MKGEEVSATKTQSEAATGHLRDIPRSYPLRFGHSNAMNRTERI
jgi:hypothetical protein